MTNITFRMTMLTAAATVGLVLACSGGASAVVPHTCPDGTKVSDTEVWKCKLKKKKSGIPYLASQGLGVKGNTASQQGHAPKPKDSTKKWGDYIFEGAKPPKPRPK